MTQQWSRSVIKEKGQNIKSDNPEPWLSPPWAASHIPAPKWQIFLWFWHSRNKDRSTTPRQLSWRENHKVGIKWHLTRRSSQLGEEAKIKPQSLISICIVSNAFQLSCGETKWGHPQFYSNLNSSKYPTANFSCNNKGLQEVWKLSPLPKKTMATPSDSVWRLSSLWNREDRCLINSAGRALGSCLPESTDIHHGEKRASP